MQAGRLGASDALHYFEVLWLLWGSSQIRHHAMVVVGQVLRDELGKHTGVPFVLMLSYPFD